MAREIVGHEVSADLSVIEHSFAQALQRLHFATKVLVRLHPEDLAYVQEHPQLWQAHRGELEFVADPALERGGCYLESERGGIDNTLATQFQSLRRQLAQAGGGENAGTG